MSGLRKSGVLRRVLQKDCLGVVSRDRMFNFTRALLGQRVYNVPDSTSNNHATAIEVFHQSTTKVIESCNYNSLVIIIYYSLNNLSRINLWVKGGV